ncbi:hypothetical protein E2C01_003308 [Portunus trituberculatus]|uniref:Uncharacterized protein n=1 Tax=Portunus trituberculatus TaxID=210409 RepID=A0A5B7CM87_PORTR|nr:hypothetical protein [Portunus trituberculatus]
MGPSRNLHHNRASRKTKKGYTALVMSALTKLAKYGQERSSTYRRPQADQGHKGAGRYSRLPTLLRTTTTTSTTTITVAPRYHTLFPTRVL